MPTVRTLARAVPGLVLLTMASAASAGCGGGQMAHPANAQTALEDGPSAEAPSLEYVFSVNVEVDPAIEQGEIDGGKTRFIPITGGRLYGPRLSGTVLPGGGDWQTIRTGGLTDIEARYFLKTDDGTVIEVHNPGVRTASPETIDKLAKGIAVPHDSYYFRTQPRFRVSGEANSWLERHVFVARGVRFPDKVIIDYYMVD